MKLTNKTIPISALRLSKYNWKREITDEDIADLAENMQEVGHLHPIIVRQVGKAGTMYEILAGARRWKAQRLMGNTKIDVRVAKCDDVMAEIISYSENLKIKRPDSKEWSAGVKRLVDLFEKTHKVGVPPKKVSPTKSKGSDDPDFCAAAAQKSAVSIMGRPTKPRANAIKDTAKAVGASERSIRYALKREEDLIPSAARALKLGKITQEQANILAEMSVTSQRQELANMVIETRTETRNRMATTKLQNLENKTPVIMNMLASVFLDCKELNTKLETLIKAADGEKLSSKAVAKLPNYQQIETTRSMLDDLLEII